MVRRGERLRFRAKTSPPRSSRSPARPASKRSPGPTSSGRPLEAIPVQTVTTTSSKSQRNGASRRRPGARAPSAAARALRTIRRAAGRSDRRVSSCSRRRFPADRVGPSAIALPCSTAPRMRSRAFVRKRWPWRSLPLPRLVAGDGPPRWNAGPTRGSNPAAQRSYWRSRSSTWELRERCRLAPRAPRSELPPQRLVVRRMTCLGWSACSSDLSLPPLSRRRIIA